MLLASSRCFFFFQAEDGIRDSSVTGVQTCALPISRKGPGLFLVPPLISRMSKVDLRIVTLTVPPQEVITRDNVTIRVTAVLYFYVVDPLAPGGNVVYFAHAPTQIGHPNFRHVPDHSVLRGPP